MLTNSFDGMLIEILKKSTMESNVIQLTPTDREALKPAELIQVNGHDSLSLNARRIITILWHNAHCQGVGEGRRVRMLVIATYAASDDLEAACCTTDHDAPFAIMVAMAALRFTFSGQPL